jgi:hypothetical protein
MEEKRVSNYKIITILAVILVAVVSVNYFGFDFQGTGYSVAQVQEFEQEENADIIWPTMERPVNEATWEHTLYLSDLGNDIQLPDINNMEGRITLNFPRVPEPGSYILVERDGERINMGFTIMRGRQMVTGIKSNAPGEYNVQYYVILDNGLESEGTLSFSVVSTQYPQDELQQQVTEKPAISKGLPLKGERIIDSEDPIEEPLESESDTIERNNL